MVRFGLTLARRTACKRWLLIFFSASARNDLQKTFLKYPGSFTVGNHMDTAYPETEESCMEWCRNVIYCRTVEYSVWWTCFLQNKTVLDVPVSAWVTGDSDYNHYQKMCA